MGQAHREPKLMNDPFCGDSEFWRTGVAREAEVQR